MCVCVREHSDSPPKRHLRDFKRQGGVGLQHCYITTVLNMFCVHFPQEREREREFFSVAMADGEEKLDTFDQEPL